MGKKLTDKFHMSTTADWVTGYVNAGEKFITQNLSATFTNSDLVYVWDKTGQEELKKG